MGPAAPHGIILQGRTTLSARLGAFLVVRRGGALPLPYAWPVGAGGACSYGADRVPVGGNDETPAAVMRLGSSI